MIIHVNITKICKRPAEKAPGRWHILVYQIHTKILARRRHAPPIVQLRKSHDGVAAAITSHDENRPGVPRWHQHRQGRLLSLCGTPS